MILEFHTPSYPLSDYVDLFTFYEGYSPGHTVDRLLPEGVVEVIIDLYDDPKFIHDNETLRPIQTCKKAWISGMRSRYISIAAAGSSMFVIRFKAGKAWPFLGNPLKELDDVVVDADIILGSAFLELREKLIETPSIPARFAMVEEYVTRRIQDRHIIHPAVEFCTDKIVRAPSMVHIQEIVKKTGYSHKHVVSLFGTYVGLTPKHLHRIMKFQQAIQAVSGNKQFNWAQLAHDCGYFDQSHFINDFKEFSGFSPLQYIEARNGYANYVPVG